MTARALYQAARRSLSAAGIEDSAAEAAILSAHFLGLDRAGLAIHGDADITGSKADAFESAVRQRCRRRPLQYILGTWEFMGIQLQVGEGVLIPREDTAALVYAAAAMLKNRVRPRCIDLCAGSGAVSLGLASLLPHAIIHAVELSDKALPYLHRNTSALTCIHAVSGDIEDRAIVSQLTSEPPDLIISNPPYVSEDTYPTLSDEVHREPEMALLGGHDGLAFYRIIAEHWAPALRCGGALAVEIGDTQAADVSAIFQKTGLLGHIQIHKDLAGHDRAVTALRNSAMRYPPAEIDLSYRQTAHNQVE